MLDVLVIGGGIVGLLSALELTKRGRKVTLLDAPGGDRKASWAGGGILSPLYAWRYPDAVTRLTVDAVSRYSHLLDDLSGAGLVCPESIMHSGGLWAECHGEDLLEATSWADRWGVSYTTRLAREVMPDCHLGGGVFFSELVNIRNPRLLKSLQALLSLRGVRLVAAQVEHIDSRGNIVRDAEGREWHASQILLAGGYKTSSMLHSCGVELPLFPAKGEMLLYASSDLNVPAVMLTARGYLIPRAGGDVVLVGSTLRKGDSSSYPSVAGRYQLEELAAELCPELAKRKPLHHWAGVRPGVGRACPYMGEVPGARGLYVATGHYRNGLVAGPASAELIAQLMCGEKPFTDPQPYSVPSSSSSSFFRR